MKSNEANSADIRFNNKIKKKKYWLFVFLLSAEQNWGEKTEIGKRSQKMYKFDKIDNV